MTPLEIARAILALTGPELVQLNEILRAEGGEGAGVRVPRTPIPPEDAARVALEPGTELEGEGWPAPAPLPEDYWESAQ